MGWTVTGDRAEFEAAALGWLGSRPTVHTVALTLLDSLRTGAPVPGDPARVTFGYWRGGDRDGDIAGDTDTRFEGDIAGAFLHAAPREMLTMSLSGTALKQLVGILPDLPDQVCGIDIDARQADLFARAWQDAGGATPTAGDRLRLHELGELRPPVPPVPGYARLAGPADRDTLVGWYGAFIEEARRPGRFPAPVVDALLAEGRITVWQHGESVVSFAARTRQVAGVVRVAPVYTPPQFRRHGYAAAVTAEVSRAARAGGAVGVVLYTDLTNPTSNRLYQRLGYEPVEDRVVLALPPAGG